MSGIFERCVINHAQKHSLFPAQVSDKTHDRREEHAQPKEAISIHSWHDAVVLLGETKARGDERIDDKECHGKDERAWDGCKGVLCP